MSSVLHSQSPLISVIVPVYNVEPYLRRCLDSILEQTYSKLEIIIVASISSDNSVKICEEYKEKDSRIILIHSEPKGLSDARNKGIEVSQGEFLSFIDSDDYIHPEFISILYSICIEHQCDIAQGGWMCVSEDESENHFDSTKDISIYSGRNMCFNYLKGIPDNIANIVTWNKLYNRKLFSTLRFPIGKIHEDEATTPRLFYSAHTVGVTTQIIYFYRSVSTSIMGQSFSIKRLDALDFFEERVHFFEEKGDFELQALALLNFSYLITSYILQLKKYCPGTEDIQKKLWMKSHSVQIEILKNSYISFKKKCCMVLSCNFPRVAHILENLKSRKIMTK